MRFGKESVGACRTEFALFPTKVHFDEFGDELDEPVTVWLERYIVTFLPVLGKRLCLYGGCAARVGYPCDCTRCSADANPHNV